MEGRVSEEPKPVQRGITSGEGSEKKKRKRFQKKWVQSEVDASLEKMGGHSESPLVKLPSNMFGIATTSRPQMSEALDQVNTRPLSAVQKGIDASEEHIREVFSELDILDDIVPRGCSGSTVISVERKYAEIALKFYEERRDAKFDILEVLFSNRVKLAIPGYEGVGLWCHVSFIAKPRSAGCIDDSPKHFFGEMLFDRAKGEYNVTYCSIFEPSDPRNIGGCVFCPQSEVFLHPADGCPAGGRESNKIMAQKGTDSSQGQAGGCSKRHPQKDNVLRNGAAAEMIMEAHKCLHLKYAKIALDFYEKSKGAEFEIAEPLFSARKPVVWGSNVDEEWWCHVTFIAKPRNADCTDVSLEHFFGELQQDSTTGKYSATYCEIFKPSDRRITHGCIICPPLDKHPFDGFRVGRPPYSIVE